MPLFIEENCVFEHEGKRFEAGGAWICDCSDGYRRGVVYVKPQPPFETKIGLQIAKSWPHKGIVTDWHSNKLADAYFSMPYRGNYCKMRCVSFTYEGIKYVGRYCPDTSEACRVKSTKKVKNGLNQEQSDDGK